jgi:hypothetical protein
VRVVHSVHERLRHRLHEQDGVVMYISCIYLSELCASQTFWEVLESPASISKSEFESAMTYIERSRPEKLLRTISSKTFGLTA